MSGELQKQIKHIVGPLRDGPVPLPSQQEEAQQRRHVKPYVRALVEEIPRRRAIRRSRLKKAGFALAACTVYGIGAIFGAAYEGQDAQVAGTATDGDSVVSLGVVSGEATLHYSTGNLQLSEGTDSQLLLSSDLSTKAGARVESSDGFTLELAQNSRLSLSDFAPGERRNVRLKRGSVTLAVPKLDAGTFAVVTDDAKVVVHGTVFSVSLVRSDSGEMATCVNVTEGVVSVHRGSNGETLRAGQSSGCRSTKEPKDKESPVSPRPKAKRETSNDGAEQPNVEPPTEQPPEAKASDATTLVQETRLFQSALAAERRGDLGRAAQQLQALLGQYPASPLTNDAKVALRRIRQKR